MKIRSLLALCLSTALVAGRAAAEDRTELERTPIVGNRELPKVLYIVPWKKPGAGPAATAPLLPPVSDALAPVDRDVLRRQLRLATPPTPSAPAGPRPANVPGDRP